MHFRIGISWNNTHRYVNVRRLSIYKSNFVCPFVSNKPKLHKIIVQKFNILKHFKNTKSNMSVFKRLIIYGFNKYGQILSMKYLN